MKARRQKNLVAWFRARIALVGSHDGRSNEKKKKRMLRETNTWLRNEIARTNRSSVMRETLTDRWPKFAILAMWTHSSAKCFVLVIVPILARAFSTSRLVRPLNEPYRVSVNILRTRLHVPKSRNALCQGIFSSRNVLLKYLDYLIGAITPYDGEKYLNIISCELKYLYMFPMYDFCYYRYLSSYFFSCKN